MRIASGFIEILAKMQNYRKKSNNKTEKSIYANKHTQKKTSSSIKKSQRRKKPEKANDEAAKHMLCVKVNERQKQLVRAATISVYSAAIIYKKQQTHRQNHTNTHTHIK